MISKTNIYSEIVLRRMTDTEYIVYLENQLLRINDNIERFIQKMDKSIFDKEVPHKTLEIYTNNIKLLKID